MSGRVFRIVEMMVQGLSYSNGRKKIWIRLIIRTFVCFNNVPKIMKEETLIWMKSASVLTVQSSKTNLNLTFTIVFGMGTSCDCRKNLFDA